MRVPNIVQLSQIPVNQSIVVIFGGEGVPLEVNLTPKEREFAEQRFKGGDGFVAINSYSYFTYLIRTKERGESYKTREELRKMAYKSRKAILENNHRELAIVSYNTYKGAVEDYAEAFVLSIYSFDKYLVKSQKSEGKRYPETLNLCGGLDQVDLGWLRTTLEAAYWVRDLINEPVSTVNSTALAEEIRKLSLSSGFQIDILVGKQIEALKMGGLLAVNKGSVDPPVFCILEHKPSNPTNKRPIVLVGKGIVYDSGGLNIKTGEHMADMKGDMAGAAAVAGTIAVISKMKLPLHVVGLIPATDNRPGGNAYTQGDIITMFNKTTVEIGNTDAEGRLILADALSYASKFDPELLVNLATLTGSAMMAFGDQAIAMMANADRRYVDLLAESGREVYERVAELPLWEEYGELIKSDVADLRNVAKGREAGAIVAGKFLEHFADAPLIHLDIAGTAITTKDDFYRLKGFPGSGLRLMCAFLKKLSNKYIEQ